MSRTYDRLRRLLGTEDPASVVSSQTYDASGNVVTKTVSRYTVAYSYDEWSRLVEVVVLYPKPTTRTVAWRKCRMAAVSQATRTTPTVTYIRERSLAV